MNEKYNGWINYETWLVSLWMSNEESCYEYWRERTREHLLAAESDNLVIQGVLKVQQTARYNLATELEDETRESGPTEENGLFVDLLNAAFSRIDWQEIADNWITEIQSE